MVNQSFYESIIFKNLLSTAILITIFYLSFFVSRWARRCQPITKKILLGVYFGVAADLLIWLNYFLRNSDLIDVKLVMIGIIATWLGLIPASIALIMIIVGALVAYGTSFSASILIIALVSCAITGYILNLAGKPQKKSKKVKYFLNLFFAVILSLQAVLWKYLILNFSGLKISLLDSGLHKSLFFLFVAHSVGLILMSEREIETKTREVENTYNELNKAYNDLNKQKEEIQDAYEQLSVSEEELRAQNEEIQTAYEKISASEEEIEMLLNVGNEAIWKYDAKTGRKKYSDRAFIGLGYQPNEVEEFEAYTKQMRHPEDAAMVAEYEQNLFSGKINQFIIEYRVRHRDGHYIWVRNRATRLIYKNGKEVGIIGSLLDISKVKEYENTILDMAYTDSLTGLPNRRAFIEKFRECLASVCEGLLNGVLFFVDTDNFKYINDVMGHNVGDDILREIGSRLRMLSDKENSFISRVGGDEFVILHIGRYDMKEIENMAKEISKVFAASYTLNGRRLQLTSSIGITTYPEDGKTVEKLMKNADIAMYNAKKKGKDGWCFFDLRQEEDADERMLMESHLRKAVENGEMVLHYQPQVNITEHKIIGFEALVRWNSPVFGMVSPGRFIPVAEDTGTIIQLGNWILKEACLFSKELNRNSDSEKMFVSVNISPLQIINPDFLEMINIAIHETEIEPDMLGIEITETALLESFGMVAEKMDILRRRGIHISLDDFGMGFSSLNHLRTLPIDTVKIDKSFIDDIIIDEKSHILTEEIIRISHKLGANIVAEGVEHEEQVELLKEYGCDIIQGYFYSKPLPKDDAFQFLLGTSLQNNH
ncbi:MAG: EAL domain-containing protein [Mobilitalea sp.]